MRKSLPLLLDPLIPEQESAPQPEERLVGREARVFRDSFSPEAEGIIEKVRGYGSLRVVEIRVHPNQPGPRIRIAHEGQWKLIEKEVAS